MNATSSDPSPPVMPVIVGAPGGPSGVTASEELEYGLFPVAFVARTLNLYAVPFVSPVIAHDVPVPVHIAAVVHDE